jgi:hypothetical protein
MSLTLAGCCALAPSILAAMVVRTLATAGLPPEATSTSARPGPDKRIAPYACLVRMSCRACAVVPTGSSLIAPGSAPSTLPMTRVTARGGPTIATGTLRGAVLTADHAYAVTMTNWSAIKGTTVTSAMSVAGGRRGARPWR